jgi:hypothetical protein
MYFYFSQDVGDERKLALVTQRLQRVLTVGDKPFWEHQLRHSPGRNQRLLRPSDADVVILIPWSRLGTD